MSFVPSKGLIDAVYAMNGSGRTQTWGRGWRLSPRRMGCELAHYRTTIATIENGELVQVGGWSASDRDAINGLCRLYGIDAGVSIEGGELGITVPDREGRFTPRDYTLWMHGRTWTDHDMSRGFRA